MKIGIMGGTFDPIHCGHLVAAERAREEAGLDQVWFLPAHVPPHKDHAPWASGEHRLAMVRLAVEGNPRFLASDYELRLGGTSYTIDTMARLRGDYPDHRFHLIIGADMVMYLPSWHRIEELTELVSFIGLQRPGYELDLERLPEKIRSSVTLVPMPLLEISSTELRQRLSSGRSARYLLPDPVLRYLEEKGLYASEPHV
ncbi:putative nicotinate-nucleotide adenylyltransferase [Paenibacillus sp. J31TS4]|uniref:nicotinate-nucleotide adenylyltransferase n=1 Tax=Paenibacillus sp. J31TS4 TaxID=2807195 RepID=UPI001B178CD6|nr:nicotinate-nucleotide adenylyltransferase [Paenibacillus sp. J31TS4]GIP39552.1 putative nicotinate-nucleotide adenylyltransferase [Paenibacillus sp. J31TS4]